MNCKCAFNACTKEYLETYYQILNRMIQGMTNVCPTDSISDNFILQMIPHHRAAIEMSENILLFTDNESLQNIAENIISEQTQSIRNMQEVQCHCSEIVNCPCTVQQYQQTVRRILGVMFSSMRNARADNHINCNFIREMIPHHEGAVRMSKNALCYTICPELIPILQAIIQSQEKGICEMKMLLHTLNCSE